jgi:hypothetical protein
MTIDKKDAVADRRNFLKLASIGAVAGGAGLVAGEKKVEAEEARPGGALYRLTDHIRRYYELAR